MWQELWLDSSAILQRDNLLLISTLMSCTRMICKFLNERSWRISRLSDMMPLKLWSSPVLSWGNSRKSIYICNWKRHSVLDTQYHLRALTEFKLIAEWEITVKYQDIFWSFNAFVWSKDYLVCHYVWTIIFTLHITFELHTYMMHNCLNVRSMAEQDLICSDKFAENIWATTISSSVIVTLIVTKNVL